MSAPLDRLYHYIETVATDVNSDTVIIYRFMPHGSKKIEDLNVFNEHPWVIKDQSPALYCYDQEPLNYAMYKDVQYRGLTQEHCSDYIKKMGIKIPNSNLRVWHNTNIFDKALLLHSELRSENVELYRNYNFIPVYYWSHAIIARDWFRAAEHLTQSKSRTDRKTFLIYNRAWSNTREYRLRFLDMIVDAELQTHCKTTFNPVEPQDKIHYHKHNFINSNFRPVNALEKYFYPTEATANSSADFDLSDYNHTDFEVVLETLFDDSRLHFTEKILRPIACGQPFLIAGPQGSLQYLRNYGFQTFGTIIDERYDTIADPIERIKAIVETMRTIAAWTPEQRADRISVVQGIIEHNKQLFFSNQFHNLIENELRINLANALTELKTTNTSKTYLDTRKKLKDITLEYDLACKTRRELASNVWTARQYYERFMNGQ